MDAIASPALSGHRLRGLTAEHVSHSVARLGLSTRSFRCIGAEVTVAELLETAEADLMQRRNFGRACLADVRRRLTLFALDGLSVPDHDPRRALLGADDPSLAAGLDAPAQTRSFGEVLEELLELLARQAATSGGARGGRQSNRPQRATLADIAELVYGCLTARERQVMEAMFGAGEPELPSLADTGRWIGLSRERVRQLTGTARLRMDRDEERRRRNWLTQELLAAFEGAGGVLSQRQLCDLLRRKHRGPLAVAAGLVRLLLEITPDCHWVQSTVWCAAVEPEQVVAALDRLHGLLRRNSRIMAMNQLAAAFRQRAGFRTTSDALITGCVAADSRFREFEGQRIGLREWEWGIPRTLEEFVIACLRSAGKPLSLPEVTAAVQCLLPPGREVTAAATQRVLDGPECVALGDGLYAMATRR